MESKLIKKVIILLLTIVSMNFFLNTDWGNRKMIVKRNLCCYLLGRDNKCRLTLKHTYKFKLSFADFKNGKLTDLILDSLGYSEGMFLEFFNSLRFERAFIKEVCMIRDSLCIIEDSAMITIIVNFLYNKPSKSVFYHYYVREYRYILEECVKLKLAKDGIWNSEVITKRVAPMPHLHTLPMNKNRYKELWKKILEE